MVEEATSIPVDADVPRKLVSEKEHFKLESLLNAQEINATKTFVYDNTQVKGKSTPFLSMPTFLNSQV